MLKQKPAPQKAGFLILYVLVTPGMIGAIARPRSNVLSTFAVIKQKVRLRLNLIFLSCHFFFVKKWPKDKPKIFPTRLTENYDFYACFRTLPGALKSCFLVSPLIGSYFWQASARKRFLRDCM